MSSFTTPEENQILEMQMRQIYSNQETQFQNRTRGSAPTVDYLAAEFSQQHGKKV
jgi:hypothetical protein